MELRIPKPGYRAVVCVPEAPRNGSGVSDAPAYRSGRPRRTLAVLPLRDLSLDQSQGAFCEAMTERISYVLRETGEFDTVALTSTRYIAGQPLNAVEIGRSLGVSLLLEGSIQTTSCQVRLSARVCDAASGIQILSRIYDHQLVDDAICLQDEISRSLRVDFLEPFDLQ
jgi:TolB-like protein